MYLPEPIDPLIAARRARRRAAKGLSFTPAPTPAPRPRRTHIVATLTLSILAVVALGARDDRPAGATGGSTDPTEATSGVEAAALAPQTAEPAPAEPGGADRTDSTAPQNATVGHTTTSRWGVGEHCEALLPLLDKYGLPDWMITVAHRESRCVADVVNDTVATRDKSYGVFQINAYTPLLREELSATCGIADPERLLDVETNIACAAALYERYGYQPWDPGTYFER